MIRVAFVCTDAGVPIFGDKGSSVHARAICRAFLDAGARVTLFASRRGGEIPPAFRDVPVVDLPAPTASDPQQRECEAIAANDRITETLTNVGPFDIVYERAALWTVAPMDYAARTAAVGILELNAPLVDEQARYRTLVHTETARRLLTTTLNAAGLVVAVSDGVAEWARGLAPAANVQVVPNGVDVRRFGLPTRRPDDAGFVIGFVGTLKPWHGVPALVDAFAAVAPHIPRASLLVVGEGPERPHLIEQVRQHRLVDRTVMTGAVPHDDVPALLGAMDVAVAPYPALDGFYFSPLKLTEYMAAGLPVVASGIGQIRSLIDDEVTGLLVRPGDAGDIAAALRRLYADRRLRHRLGAAARAFVIQHCTWTSVLERVVRLAGIQPLDWSDAASGSRAAGIHADHAGRGFAS